MKDSLNMSSVLIVDDDPDALADDSKILGNRYVVLAATNGGDALRMARAARPDVIVLDVMLADGQDGFVVFRELQREPSTRHIPIISPAGSGKSWAFRVANGVRAPPRRSGNHRPKKTASVKAYPALVPCSSLFAQKTRKHKFNSV